MSIELEGRSGAATRERGSGNRSRIAVIGGGITGLSAAHRVGELCAERGLDASVVLLESDRSLGGHVRTERSQGCLLEGGPDSLVLAKPAGVSLCNRLGLAGEIVRPATSDRGLHILHRGRLVPLPAGFLMMAPTRLGPVLRSPLFSVRGKLRMAAEPFVPRAISDGDESLGSFVTRRFGREVLERVAEPVLASLYTADADRLSLETALPRFRGMERTHGNVTRALAQARREKRQVSRGRHAVDYSGVASLRDGLGTIVDALRARLPKGGIRTGVRIEAVFRGPLSEGWAVAVDGTEILHVDAVILACPAYASAELLRRVDPALAAELERLPYASCATVHLAYRQSDLGRPPTSFGFFVPRTERRPLLACSFVSVKFPERSPRDTVLVRAFLGGALHPEAANLDEESLADLAHHELRAILDTRAAPLLRRTHRFHRAMPQYEVGFPSRLEVLTRRLAKQPGLFLAGSSVGAVGLPDCIASGEKAAAAAVDACRIQSTRTTRVATPEIP